jgi:hypothetical protein
MYRLFKEMLFFMLSARNVHMTLKISSQKELRIIYQNTYLVTYLLTYVLTHSLTYVLTYLLTHSLTYLCTYLLT